MEKTSRFRLVFCLNVPFADFYDLYSIASKRDRREYCISFTWGHLDRYIITREALNLRADAAVEC